MGKSSSFLCVIATGIVRVRVRAEHVVVKIIVLHFPSYHVAVFTLLDVVVVLVQVWSRSELSPAC